MDRDLRKWVAGGTAVILVVSAALLVLLVVSSVRVLRELDRQKEVYLRSRAAAVAAKVERLGPAGLEDGWDVLADEEPALISVQILEPGRGEGAAPVLKGLWEGRELYREEGMERGGTMVYRLDVAAALPEGLRVVRVELDRRAADFLTTHARHNVVIALVSGLALVALAAYAAWAGGKAARLQVQQARLEHLAQLGEMSAVLAHEIRNPLGTVKGFVQLAAEQAGRDVGELLDPALKEIGRLEELVRDLLFYGRPPNPSPRLVRWQEIAKRLGESVRHLAGEKGVRIEVEGGSLWLETDPDLLERALINLVRNGVEAVEPGGVVRVMAFKERDGSVRVEVTDNGPGIPEEIAARVFQPFFTTKTTGTGLGLPIASSLVRSLGGDLKLSKGVPQGTVATIRLPRAAVAGRDEFGEKV